MATQPNGTRSTIHLGGLSNIGTDAVSPTSIKILDLDGDGKKELWITLGTSGCGLGGCGAPLIKSDKIYRPWGGSTFNPPLTQTQLEQFKANHVWGGNAFADLNGDGKSDYYIANSANGTIHLNYAYSTGTALGPLQSLDVPGDFGFFSPSPTPHGNAAALLATDVNGDGKADLVVLEQVTHGASYGDGVFNVGVFVSTGTGFVHQVWAHNIAYTGRCAGPDGQRGCLPTMLAGDFDGDGRQDLALNTHGSPRPPADVVPDSTATILLSRGGIGPNGEDGFSVVPGQFASVADVADVDADGRDDLLEGALRIPSGTSAGFVVQRNGNYYGLTGECQEFRVRAGIMGKKETPYVTTQSPLDS